MASFSEGWNAAFEALPPDQGENASLGASRIRAFKIAVRERLAIDHSLAGDGDDGKHKQVTLINRSTDPSIESGDYSLYVKNGQLVLKSSSSSATGFGFGAGTKMLFQQTAAPTGWTKLTSHNNKALRVVSGSVSSGGSTSFTSVFASTRTTSSSSPGTSAAGAHSHGGATASHALTIAQMPSHAHSFTAGTVTGGDGFDGAKTATPGTSSTSSTGGNQGHSHGIGSDGNHTHTVSAHAHSLNMNVAYVDIIIAQKD